MKILHIPLTLSLLALSSCIGFESDTPLSTRNTPFDLQHMLDRASAPRNAEDEPKAAAIQPVNAHTTYAADGQGCSARASSRMAMMGRSDLYPLSDQERRDGYHALYSACMQGHDWQVAGREPANDAAQLAAISPAAGGASPGSSTVTAGNTRVTASAIPGGTLLVIGNKETTPPLSSLSPSSGGDAAQNMTVVLLAPQTAAPVQSNAVVTAPAAAPALAMPVPPATPPATMPGRAQDSQPANTLEP